MENESQKSIILSLKNISKSFGDRQILSDVTFDIYEGEVLGILGLSGSGKSTLLKILCGFLAEDLGRVSIPNRRSDKSLLSDSEEIREMIGFSAQLPSFYPELTVFENLAYFGTLLDVEGVKLTNKIDEILRILDLYDVKKVYAGNLSEGMKKRLDIACSIVHDPKILILDEPTANLDYKLREELLCYVKKINREKNITILFVSHYIEEIESICDRVILLVKHKTSVVENIKTLRERFSVLVETKKSC